MALAPGTRIGTYEILATLGAGAMGEVYRARDVRLGREAIKFMLDTVAADPEHRARFEREAQTLAALNHPNIAQIYGLEEATDGLALVMEMIDGPTLADRISAGTVSIEQTIYIALQLAAALESRTSGTRSIAISSRPTSSCGPTSRSRSSTSGWRRRCRAGTRATIPASW